jgi:hypothetical protein
MMEIVTIIMLFIFFLSCGCGAVYLFYNSIRSFIAKEYWYGIRALIFAFFLGLIVVSSVFPRGDYYGEKGLRIVCNHTQRSLVLFMRMYADDHDGKYPVTFNDMAGEYIKAGDLKVFTCPASHHQVGSLTNIYEWTDYAYVSGLTEADPTNCVVMFCLPDNHKGKGANVGFLGGIVKWYSCKPDKEAPSFQDLTNTPSLFYGTTNVVQLADLKKRARIIYPKQRR